MTAENESRLPGHPYVPSGPLEDGPPGGYQPAGVRREALAAVLDGIPLGAYDRRVLDWLAGLDDPTCRTLASVMLRCRLAAPPGSVTEWGARFANRDGTLQGVQRYYDEEDARRARRQLNALDPSREDTVVSRQTWAGPWTPVPPERPS